MEEAGRIQKPKKNTGSLILIIPKRLSLKKKKGSDSDLKLTDSFNSNPDLKKALGPSSPTRFSFKKVENWNCDLPFTGHDTKKAYSQDPSFLKFLPKSKPEPEDSKSMEKNNQNNDDDDEKLKNMQTPLDTSDYHDDNEKNDDQAVDPVDPTPGMDGSDATVIDHSFEAVSDEESADRPIICDSRVRVEDQYFVKQSVSGILRSILNKYGDIARNCQLASSVMRSYYLEYVCLVIRELQSWPSIDRISKSKVTEMLAIAHDVEAAGIEVGWLKKGLDEIKGAVEMVKKGRLIEAEKKKVESNMGSVREVLEACVRSLEEKEKEVEGARAEVEEARERLGKIEEEFSRLDEMILSIKSKVDRIDFKAKVDSML